ncbi:MAG: Uncharacterized protein G01um10147_998 [Microgenomates group bacterium Gr01-1014_7]|nr:MAG: Uncharacterized protein G01um10147_998 [Microgenomates group bacterium Gr01-1014_7]
MKKFIFIFLSLFFFFLFVQTAEAKVLPQSKQGGKVASKSAGGSGINVSPVLRADRKALNVYFSNLQNATSVSYFLTYETSAQQEGAGGSLHLGVASTQSAELLFGTCSKNVCRYHTGIKNAKLEITYTLKSSKKFIKRYRIKV